MDRPAPDAPLVRHPLRRARVRAGWHGLAAGVALSLVFVLWPGIDLWASGLFRTPAGRFIGDDYAWVRAFYVVGHAAGVGYPLLTGAVLAAGRLWPGRVPFRWRRRAGALLLVSVVAGGLVVNVGLKEHWGRARPVQVTEFGGLRHFSPMWRPSDQCPTNCSFSSGHAAAGFLVMSVGLMGPVAVRRRWWWTGLGIGLLASLARVMQGGHFLSDTLFSGWVVWGCGWVVREAWLWRVARRRRALREAAAG